jgi:hypothetical protein
MNGQGGFLEGLFLLIQTASDVFWTLVATFMDLVRDAGPFSCGLAVVVFVGVGYFITLLMQSHHNKTLAKKPDEPVNMFLQELLFTAPGLLLWLLALPFILVFRLVRGVKKSVSSALEDREKRKKEAAKKEEGMFGDLDDDQGVQTAESPAPDPSRLQATGDEDAGEEEDEDNPDDEPLLVASLGPSFLGGAVITGFLYIFGIITEPLLRLQLRLSEGLPAWEFLIIGDRPELQWYLPLSEYPWMGGAVTVGFWCFLWWQSARIIRLVLHKQVGANLIGEIEDGGVLPYWRSWFGAPELYRPDDTYMRWAKWLPMASVPFLLFSWLSMGGDPYRMSPSMFAISLLLAISWGIHFSLEGIYRPDDSEDGGDEDDGEVIRANAWDQVLEDVTERFQLRPPHIFEPPRAIEPLAFSTIDPESEGIVSPLLTELLPEPREFTHMQYVVLRTLSLLGYIHTDPPLPRGELDLGTTVAGQDETTGRHRNQIVLAPEGFGKSTMAMLAACNHAIIHTRSTLIVTRDESRALSLFQSIRRSIEPSTLRWNIRERRVGGDVVNDLAQGIVPDIIVCSLRQLVINILDEPLTYAPFLENLGLIIIDDVESFCGAVETHAQLAFRRLILRVNQMLGVKELGEEHAPMMLVLGADTMHDTPAWARTLCGVDAVARYFDYSSDEASEREAALKAYHGIAPIQEEGGEERKKGTTPGLQGHFHLTYRLNDFRNADDEVLDIQDLIESCERLAVPWHYRPCGDIRRHVGRQRLHLRDEPKYHKESPLEAGVIILEGHWSEVRREIARLRRAGADFSPVKSEKKAEEESLAGSKKKKKKKKKPPTVPVAIVTVIDRDEEMALTELNQQSTLADSLTTLPRPVVRPPVGRMVLEHLSAEMTSNWVEVGDVLDIFGNASARTLTRLADAGMLMSEERVDLHPDIQLYDNRVYVRATSRAMGDGRRHTGLLPPKVSQVELPSGDSVHVRDRTNLNIIDFADGESAHHVYYPGKIFEHAMGRFVVVGYGVDEEDQVNTNANARDQVITHDVLVEPFLGEGLSSPRRRLWVYHCDEKTAIERHLMPYHPAVGPPPRVLPEELPQMEPVLIGDFPVATSMSRVSCVIEHVATYRLGERHGEVRQRIIADPELEREHLKPVGTMALGLYPNPEVDFELDDDPPQLRLEEARLIAAAMRAVLPSMYRGADFSLEVGIQIDALSPEADHVFSPSEGFYFFDPQPGGNGASRALHRDGVELLLRLCRVYIERVLYHDRLRARYDYWGDESEIVAGQADGAPEASDARGTWFVDLESLGIEDGQENDGGSGDERTVAPGTAIRQRDREIRKRALIWLDSRLRPEGSLSGGRRVGNYGSGSEEGEGDISDIGRCWYSRVGTVTDLLWTKHRWRLDEAGGEAMADVGFDRDTAAESRFFGPESPGLKPDLKMMSEQLQNPGFMLSDQTVWGAARPLWVMESGMDVPVGTDGELVLSQPMRDHQLFASAITAHDFEALEPLALLLQERSWTDTSTLKGRYDLVDYITRFVQGIPSTGLTEPRLGARPPVHTLLHRIGDADSKSLVLAILLRHCGFDTGLFVSLEGKGAMCAVALVEGGAGEEGDPEVTIANLQQWREAVGLKGEDLLWGELPSRPGGPEAPLQLYLPVDPMRDLAPGQFRIEKPDQWAFMPLAPVWFKVGVYEKLEEEAEKEAEEKSGDGGEA